MAENTSQYDEMAEQLNVIAGRVASFRDGIWRAMQAAESDRDRRALDEIHNELKQATWSMVEARDKLNKEVSRA